MTKRFLLALLLLGAGIVNNFAQSFSNTVKSPDKRIQVTVMLSELGEPSYKIRYKGKA